MRICNKNHIEISFTEKKCPICGLLEKEKFVPVEYILGQIDNDLINLEHWYKARISANIVRTEEEIDVLLRIIETIFIGQVGGFDNGQKDRTLKGRYEWLKNHIGNL